MPFMLPAAAGASAIGTAALGGAAIGTGAALGTGIAAGAALAGGAGLLGNLGLSTIGAPALGGLGGAALTPTVASLAPAATAQALGPSMLQSAGLDALKSQALQGGLAQMPTAGLTQAAVNPTLAQQIAQQQAVANTARQSLLAQSGGQNIMGGAGQMATPTTNAAAQMQAAGGAPTSNLATQMQTAQLKGAGQAVLPADTAAVSGIQPGQNFLQNIGNFFQNPSMQGVKDYAEEHPYVTSAVVGLGAKGLVDAMQQKGVKKPEDTAMIRPYTYERTQRPEAYAVSPGMDSSERLYFNDQFTAGEPYKATEKAEGGIAAAYAVGGPVEQMAAMNSVGMNTGYPMAGINTPVYSNPMMQRPEATNVIAPSADAGVGAYSGEPKFAAGGQTLTGSPLDTTQAIMGPTIYNSAAGTGQRIGGIRVVDNPLPNTGSGLPPWAVLAKARQEAAKAAEGPPYTYNPTTMQFTDTKSGKITGGISQANAPTSSPTQAPSTVQPAPAYAPLNIPAYQTPEQQLGLTDFYNMMNQRLAGYGGYGGYAAGGDVAGESTLGSYSDGGRLLKGPGDGVSDSIPAVIGKRQPARLADGEFVVPARIVSELGNGSTEAGARKLYAMMERVQKARKKSIGKKKVAVNSKADKHLPA